MSPRDILEFFLRVPNPQIRTALSGPPPAEDHPLPAAEVWPSDDVVEEEALRSANRSDIVEQ